MENCIFCKIIRGEIPSQKLYEDEDFLIFNNIKPNAKYHYLAILKEHFTTLVEMNQSQAEKLCKLLAKIPTLKDKLHLENGYRLIINQKGEQGNDASQEVMHLHIHILAGQKMKWEPA